MRNLYFILLLSLILGTVFGCSSGGNSPTSPGQPIISEDVNSNSEILFQGSFEIDLENQQIIQIERQTDTVYNITGFLPNKCPGGCFRFRIIGIIGTVLEIELTIENPLTIQVYDVRIQYLDTFGKTVLNPDSYSDFLGAQVTQIYPFTAFMKETEDRAFPVGPVGIDTETLYLDFPPGSQASVNYAITASFPGQTREPFQISDMAQTGTLTPSGGSATISCRVQDHQMDISRVILDSRPITGGYSFMVAQPGNPEIYEKVISNTMGAPEGTYNQLMMAQSSNPQTINTYNFVELTVQQGSAVTAYFTSTPYPDAYTCENIDFDASLSDGGGYPIAEYHWDWDYAGDPSGFVSDLITDAPYAWHQYATEGRHVTGLKVVNSAPSPEFSDVFSDALNLTQPLVDDYSVQEVHRISFNSEGNELWMSSSNAIVVDNNDVVHVFVRAGQQLLHQWYDNGTTGEEVLGTVAGYPHQSAQLDSKGFIHVVWYQSDGLVYSENSSGSFSTPVPIVTEFESSPYSHCLGINGQDELMVVYYEAFSTTHPMNYLYKTTSGWTEPALLTYPYYQTGSPGSELALMVACAGTPGYNGQDFHAVWTQQFTEGYMNPVVTYSKFNGVTRTWSASETVAPSLPHYQDWPDVTATEDGDVFIGSSYYWDNCFVSRKDAVTGAWTTWMIAQTANDEYSATIGANNDGTVCVAYWERIGYPDPDPFEVQYKIFHESMSQAEVDAIPSMPLDPGSGYNAMYNDIYTKDCSYYVAFGDQRDTAGGNFSVYFGRISP